MKVKLFSKRTVEVKNADKPLPGAVKSFVGWAGSTVNYMPIDAEEELLGEFEASLVPARKPGMAPTLVINTPKGEIKFFHGERVKETEVNRFRVEE